MLQPLEMVGLVAVGAVVWVAWLAFRRMAARYDEKDKNPPK